MKSLFIFGVANLAMVMGHGQTATAIHQDTIMPIAAQQALVTKYCAGCHNDKLKSGGFSWTKINLAHVDARAEQTERRPQTAGRHDAARRRTASRIHRYHQELRGFA